MNFSKPEDGKKKVGILALQGDFEAHGRVLEGLGVSWRKVVIPEDFEGLEGLIIPGGESTTLLKLLDSGLKEEIVGLAKRGGVVYGTCAGAILLARRVLAPNQHSLGLLDVVVIRNGYGRQVHSFLVRQGDEDVEGEGLPRELVFIRAPVFQEVGPRVRVLARVRNHPVYVQEDNILATTFHPELTSDPSIHIRFLGMMK